MRTGNRYVRRLAGSLIVFAAAGTGRLASADVIGVDAVRGNTLASVLATGGNFDDFRGSIAAMGQPWCTGSASPTAIRSSTAARSSR